MNLAEFELWFYGGIAAMLLAGVFFAVQIVIFLLKRRAVGRQMDEEYGQPLKYNRKDEEEQVWQR